MTIFSAIHTAGSGLKVMRTWMDAVGDNVANMNDVVRSDQDAFRERYVVAQAKSYGEAGQPGITAGAEVGGVQFGDAGGRLVYDPSNPLADGDGMVKYPNIDLGDQMTQMIVAQRGYQANLSIVDRVRDAYQQALQIGKGG